MPLTTPAALRRTAVAATTLLTAIAGVGLAGGEAGAAVSPASYCAGQSVPALPGHTPNAAPTPQADTARVVAGIEQQVRVLGNDTDPDGDRLVVVSVSAPRRGEACVNGDGTVEYSAPMSTRGYTDTFTYAVTDGDYLRTARVTVTVEGVLPLRAQLVRKLHKRPALVKFTNPNKHPMFVIGGNPKAKKPAFRRSLPVGGSVTVSTRSPRLVFLAGIQTSSEDAALADVGMLNTRTGRQRIVVNDDSMRLAGRTAGPALLAQAKRALTR